MIKYSCSIRECVVNSGHTRVQFCCCKGISKGIIGRYSSSWEPHLTAMQDVTCHNGITQCYLPPDTSERARLIPVMQAGTRFTYPGGMEG